MQISSFSGFQSAETTAVPGFQFSGFPAAAPRSARVRNGKLIYLILVPASLLIVVAHMGQAIDNQKSGEQSEGVQRRHDRSSCFQVTRSRRGENSAQPRRPHKRTYAVRLLHRPLICETNLSEASFEKASHMQTRELSLDAPAKATGRTSRAGFIGLMAVTPSPGDQH